MIFLYIFLSLIAIVLLLLLLPIRLHLTLTDGGDLRVRASLSILSLYRHPEKETPFRLAKYSPRAIAARQRKEQRRLKKQQKKAAKKPIQKKTTPAKAPSLRTKINKITQTLSLISSLIDALHERLFRATHVHVYRLVVHVGSDDAAKTALLYGVVCPAATLLLETLHQCTNLHVHHPTQMQIAPDFTSDRFRAELDLRLDLRVVHALTLGIRALMHIIRHKQTKRTPATTSLSTPTPNV